MQERAGHHVAPAQQYYEWLLTAAGIRGDSLAVHAANPVVSWFPPPLRSRIQTALARTRPLVQEAIGWEFLSAQFNIVINANE